MKVKCWMQLMRHTLVTSHSPGLKHAPPTCSCRLETLFVLFTLNLLVALVDVVAAAEAEQAPPPLSKSSQAADRPLCQALLRRT